MPETHHHWTFMVYMAGDNGKRIKGKELMGPMEEAGYEDLLEMQRIGSTNEVAVLVQFDTLAEESESYRLHVQSEDKEQIWEQIPEQNMGDPNSLMDFLIWGMGHFPAERYAVVLWNHGSGWKEDDIYAFARSRGLNISTDTNEIRSGLASEKLACGLFLSSAMQVVAIEDEESRAIAYDDSSMDFLDNAELQGAFRMAEKKSGRKLDLIGMDACLMSMIEVAYQLRDSGQVMVSSQEVEPMVGWPYKEILEKLTQNPGMTARELGQTIVQQYGSWFEALSRGDTDVTQSAIGLGQVAYLVGDIEELSESLLRLLEQGDIYLERALFRALRDVLRFRDKDYLDLDHFLTLLSAEYSGGDLQLIASMKKAQESLSVRGDKQIVLENYASAGRLSKARGLSIYLPTFEYSRFYDRLDFAKFGWGEFVQTLNRS